MQNTSSKSAYREKIESKEKQQDELKEFILKNLALSVEQASIAAQQSGIAAQQGGMVEKAARKSNLAVAFAVIAAFAALLAVALTANFFYLNPDHQWLNNEISELKKSVLEKDQAILRLSEEVHLWKGKAGSYGCAIVTTEYLFIREGPRASGAALGGLKEGAVIQVADLRDMWYQFEFINASNETITGWINSRYTENVDCDRLPSVF